MKSFEIMAKFYLSKALSKMAGGGCLPLDPPLMAAALMRRLVLHFGDKQGWKLKPKLKPENPVLRESLETQTETETYLIKSMKT